MPLRHPGRWSVAALLVPLVLALAALPAAARPGYLLHVKIAKNSNGHGLDFAMPWDVVRGGSPFDFVSEHDDHPGVERLRAAWTTLRTLPEGRTVTIASDHGRTRAYRHAGWLVLEPLDDPDDADSRIRIPGEIVEAVLRRDGRLTGADVDRLLDHRDELGLVGIDGQKGHVEVWIERDRDSDPD